MVVFTHGKVKSELKIKKGENQLLFNKSHDFSKRT
jgi:hypothetical protein